MFKKIVLLFMYFYLVCVAFDHVIVLGVNVARTLFFMNITIYYFVSFFYVVLVDYKLYIFYRLVYLQKGCVVIEKFQLKINIVCAKQTTKYKFLF